MSATQQSRPAENGAALQESQANSKSNTGTTTGIETWSQDALDAEWERHKLHLQELDHTQGIAEALVPAAHFYGRWLHDSSRPDTALAHEVIEEVWGSATALDDLGLVRPVAKAIAAGRRSPIIAVSANGMPVPTAAEYGRLMFERTAEAEKTKELARREGRRRADAAEAQATVAPPAALTGTQLLAQPDDEEVYLIDQLWPAEGNIVLAAQRKAGKTTTVLNVVRSLVDGQPFLGRYAVTPLRGCVEVWDLEMSPKQYRRWLRRQGVMHTDWLTVRHFRGNVASLNLLNPQIRAQLATQLRAANVQVLVLDCLRPLMDALGLDENRDFGRLSGPLDALKAESGVTELLVVHHAGHADQPGEARSRGDSRIRDWPDAEWFLARKDKADASPRMFWTFGREVDTKKAELTYEADHDRLSLGPDFSSRIRTLQQVGVHGPENPKDDPDLYSKVVEMIRDYGEPMAVSTMLEGLDIPKSTLQRYLKLWRTAKYLRGVPLSTRSQALGYEVVEEKQPRSIEPLDFPGVYAGQRPVEGSLKITSHVSRDQDQIEGYGSLVTHQEIRS
ncbi:AAA domain-containing protein [Prauserella shujinwangii]|uniref:AAA domain-containing protein n=1 Tax=Prauserella shujinwangii TaxID=1453103 RepID=A0A2T0LXB5_9PSEU|nr:AAA family ATPase [Prauserella shujinwangii]PRX48671.1 AAA domain-containing protein [Prauserella shujinwangii]